MEDDPVVKEIPVFLSKTLENKLLLLQYPTYPMKDGKENFTVLKSSMKPESLEIQLEFAINTNSSNYDHSKGVQLVLNAKNESKKNENIFDSDLFDKMMLSSKRSVTDCSNFAIGIFQDGELHITPLKGILEMRPQFNYLDKSDKRAKDETKTPGEDSDEEEENAPVKVTFARHQPDHVKKIQEQSFQYNSKKTQEEWIHTKYVPIRETLAHLTRLEMFCPMSDITLHSLNLSAQEYLDLLTQSRWRTTQNNTESFELVKTLLLQEQITSFMKNARVMSFSNLRAVLSSEHSATDVLRCLQKVAVLVQGNWVIRSELIYPNESTSSENGIPGELMCKARDYILLLLTDHVYIKRDKVLSVVKLPLEEVTEIFEKLCTNDSKEGWKLMIPPDWNFCNRYQDLAERQQIFWEAKRKHLRESHTPQRQRRKSNRESLGSENEEKNISRGRKSHRDSSLSDNDGVTELVKPKKTSHSRKNSETSTT